MDFLCSKQRRKHDEENEDSTVASLRWHYPDQVQGYISLGKTTETPSVWL
jgi:hypothetical protein